MYAYWPAEVPLSKTHLATKQFWRLVFLAFHFQGWFSVKPFLTETISLTSPLQVCIISTNQVVQCLIGIKAYHFLGLLGTLYKFDSFLLAKGTIIDEWPYIWPTLHIAVSDYCCLKLFPNCCSPLIDPKLIYLRFLLPADPETGQCIALYSVFTPCFLNKLHQSDDYFWCRLQTVKVTGRVCLFQWRRQDCVCSRHKVSLCVEKLRQFMHFMHNTKYIQRGAFWYHIVRQFEGKIKKIYSSQLFSWLC